MLQSYPFSNFCVNFFLCFSPFVLWADYSAADKARMISDFDILRNEIEINYAPADWKKSYFHWDLDNEMVTAHQKILAAEPLNPRGYQQIIRDFFNSLRDLHVNVSFYSTEYAVLPFLVQGVNNRYFVVWVSEKWPEDIPLEVGDEILSFDGQPVGDIIKDLQLSAYGPNESETFRHLGELLLTVREGDALKQIPQGSVEIIFKKNNQKRASSFLTEWKYVAEEIDNHFLYAPIREKAPFGQNSFFCKIRALPLYTRWKSYHPDSIYGSQWLGSKQSFFPPLGPTTWKSNSETFEAYIYTHKGKKIGYLRIPDFHGDTKENEEFREIIAVMQGCTQALVIDLMNNPGGLAFYTYGLLSMLSDQPLRNLKEQLSITQKDVYFAIEDLEWLDEVKSDQESREILGSDIFGYQVDYRMAQALVKLGQFIKEQYKQGKYLTESFPMEGLEFIYPHPTTRYTKPLFLLTNSLSISCGDVFPAILQDNKRAKILGAQTAGAGGYVLARKYSNRFGLASFTLTGSLIHRLDGQPLENLGVKPDILYEFTEEDYIHNYSNFINFVNKSIINK